VLKVCFSKECIDINTWHVRLAEGLLHLSDPKHTSVVEVKSSEFLAQGFDVKSRVLDKEAQSFDLETFVHMEVLEAL